MPRLICLGEWPCGMKAVTAQMIGETTLSSGVFLDPAEQLPPSFVLGPMSG